MKTILIILSAIAILVFEWFVCQGDNDSAVLTGEQAEEARKKLSEQQDKDINLDLED